MKRLLLSLAASVAVSSAAVAAGNIIPTYINTAADTITMNGADWSALRQRANALRAGVHTVSVLRVLHIGDSHIQAEFITNELRRLLQEEYGNAGRGLIAPLRLAGTNQPHDYAVTATPAPDGNWKQTRLLKLPWPVTPGFTGIAAQPQAPVSVTFRAMSPGHDIASAKVFTSAGTRQINPATPGADSITVPVAAGEAVYGALLENGRRGLLYSAIGNNGACFNDYLLIPGFAKATEAFKPDLIILSMGTNEGFSAMTDDEIRTSTRTLIAQMRAHNPGAELLVLTPMECQRNRNHGFRPKSPYYDINDKVAHARDLILEVCAADSVPVWDLYPVAGGHGSSARWLDDKLMNTDRIHCLKPGYELQARLLFDALMHRLR